MLRLSLWHTQTYKSAGYTKIIVENGLKNQGLRKPGSTSSLTLLEPSRRHKDHQELRTPKDMQWTCTPHKPMRRFSPRCSRTTSWRWKISQQRHKPTKPWSRCWQRRSRSYWAKLLPWPWNSKQRNPRIPVWKSWDIVWPRPSTAIGRPAIQPHQIKTRPKTAMYIQRTDKNSTLTGISHLTNTRWRNHTYQQLVASQKTATKIGNAAGNQGRSEMEQGADQWRSCWVRRGGIR